MSGKHTPTPWSVPKTDTVAVVAEGNDYERRRRVVTRALYKPHQRARAEANAAFIVKAVNAHDKLVSALESAYRLLQADDPTGALAQLPAGGAQCEELVEQAVAIIRTALASVKEPGE